jgi:hypothetical protein
MALIFSLSAALLATLVQQWVRDYMHVFQRYSDPLKSARIRQYLHEGCEGWYMPVVAEAVPGLLHTSVFLFFIGLGDFVLNINTAVGLSTTIPIGIIGLLYIFTTFAPVIYPQSPYQNSFSGLIWYLVQKLGVRKYKDRDSGGMLKSASSNMVEGQMQLAMEETDERMGRDARAIRWLVGNQTADAEMESLAMTIPGSFNAEWGIQSWKRVSEIMEDESKSTGGSASSSGPLQDANSHTDTAINRRSSFIIVRRLFGPILRPIRICTAGGSRTNTVLPSQILHLPDAPIPGHSVTAPVQGDTVVRELSTRIAELLESCKNRGLFASDELWRRRSRACVETTTSLVFCANAKFEWFGDIGQLLREIGKVERTRESSLAGMDHSFVTRWTCLSITAIRSMLKFNSSMQQAATKGISELGVLVERPNCETRTLAEDFDVFLGNGWGPLFVICQTLFKDSTNVSEGRLKEVLRLHQFEMDALKDFYTRVPLVETFDRHMLTPHHSVQVATHELICELPGIELDCDRPEPLPFHLALELLHNIELQFMLFGRCAVGLSSIYPRLQNFLEGQDREPGQFQELLNDLKYLEPVKVAPLWKTNLVQLQLWRFQDLCFAGGLGFTIEIFFISLKQLLSTSPSNESQSALYINTFRAITSDWSIHKHSLATQEILLNLISSYSGLMSRFNYPAYITDELLVFVDSMFKGQTGPHIDDAVERLRTYNPRFSNGPPAFPARALEVLLSSSQPPAPLSS